jgi:aerobic-type carbon monoxide dehydrogenase small subunit (CoxS/CutS family)
MKTIELSINQQVHRIEVDPEMPLLWAIRDIVGLKGTKFGCGQGLCGACTVQLDGQPIRSCQTPVGSITAKQKITTIEGASTRAPSTAMWLLPIWPNHVSHRFVEIKSKAHRNRHRELYVRKYLPLRYVFPD